MFKKPVSLPRRGPLFKNTAFSFRPLILSTPFSTTLYGVGPRRNAFFNNINSLYYEY